jgi:hypothetical protein
VWNWLSLMPILICVTSKKSSTGTTRLIADSCAEKNSENERAQMAGRMQRGLK